MISTDLLSDAGGIEWGMGRIWSQRSLVGMQESGHWSVENWPRLIKAGGGYAVVVGNQARYFDLAGEDTDSGTSTYAPRFSSNERLSVNDGALEFTDTSGNTITFHGFGEGIAMAQRGMFKKIESAGGQTLSGSYDGDGRLSSVTRGGDTFTYDYLCVR